MIFKGSLSDRTKNLKKLMVVTSDHHWVRCKSIFTTFFFVWRKYLIDVEIKFVSCETLSTPKNDTEKEWKAEEEGRKFFLLSEGF